MTTPMVTLTHPNRKDTKTVSTAAARVHKRAGWVEAADADQIPSDAKALVTWIGDDTDRADAALVAEQSRPKPRKSVLAHIETVTTPVTPTESQED